MEKYELEGNEVEGWAGRPSVAVENTLADTMEERGNRYGDFTDHSELCQAMGTLMAKADRASGTSMNPTQKEAVKMILVKLSRIAVGDCNYIDNWHDIQGFAKLGEDHLKRFHAE